MNPTDVLTITMRESGPLCRRTYDAPDGRRMSETVTVDEVIRMLRPPRDERPWRIDGLMRGTWRMYGRAKTEESAWVCARSRPWLDDARVVYAPVSR
jgi:hypothetical protein